MPDGRMKVAVAVTTFNDVEYTRGALQTLLENTHDSERYEVVFYLLDDCSHKVDTSLLLAEFRPREIAYHRNESNLGLTALWNRGYQLARDAGCDYYIIYLNGSCLLVGGRRVSIV